MEERSGARFGWKRWLRLGGWGSESSQLREHLNSKMAGMRLEPAWLEEGRDTATCALCTMVLKEPTSGCPQGHAVCKECYVEELSHRKKCPICRDPTDESKCVPSRQPQSLSA